MKHAVFSICSLLIVVVICGTLLYSCSNASDRYYSSQKDCVSQGGTWIPVSGNGTGYSAACAFSRGK